MDKSKRRIALANIKLQGRLSISSAHNAVDKPAACNHKRPIILWVNCCCRSFGAREEIALGGDSIHIVLLLLIASMCAKSGAKSAQVGN